MGKLAVFFPGIGYHCDKPLLYYTKKLARERGFEVVEIEYSHFPKDIKSSKERMRVARVIALEQAKNQLQYINFKAYESVVFVSKSIGTSVATCYSQLYGSPVHNVFFTPVEITFDYPVMDGISFSGTMDTWIAVDKIKELAIKNNLPLHLVENANHSLETGDAITDILNLKIVMQKVAEYLDRL